MDSTLKICCSLTFCVPVGGGRPLILWGGRLKTPPLSTPPPKVGGCASVYTILNYNSGIAHHSEYRQCVTLQTAWQVEGRLRKLVYKTNAAVVWNLSQCQQLPGKKLYRGWLRKYRTQIVKPAVGFRKV